MKYIILILLGLALAQAFNKVQYDNNYFMEESSSSSEEDEIEEMAEFFEELYDIQEDYKPVFVNDKKYPLTNDIVEEYDIELGKMLAGFSQAAYCKKKKIEKWKCGKVCKEYPFMTDIINIQNGVLKDNHAYLGYYSANDIIVAVWKGSFTLRNWLEDFDFIKTKYPYCEGCEVHEGFNKAYNTMQDQFWDAYLSLREKYPNARLVVTGHSLGGALSTMNAGDLIEKGVNDFLWYNFGCPRVGNENFSTWLQNAFTQRLYRVTHHKDPVPHLPPESFGFHHLAQEVFYVKNDDPDAEHILCNMSGEDPDCSDKYLLDLNVLDHLNYEGWDWVVRVPLCLI